MRHVILKPIRLAAVATAILLPLGAQAQETGGSAPTLESIGLDLEGARALTGPAVREAAGAAGESLRGVMKSGLEPDRKTAAWFLSGELHYRMEDYEKALESFRKAEKEGKKTPFADDAGLGAIAVLEAQGRDEEAAEAWKEWDERYPKSPLRGEAHLAWTWNALRRGALPEASRRMMHLVETWPWMEQDPRFALAVATAAFLDGRSTDALAALELGGDGPSATYLRALCHAAEGDMLKAAAKFQETAQRFPDSPLHDYALLAKANTFLQGGAYQSAGDEFLRVVELVSRPEVRAEAELRHASSVFLAGDAEAGSQGFRQVAETYAGTTVAARAQFLLGEVLFSQEDLAGAIVEFNQVLRTYFENELASSAQYRVAQCLDRLDRDAEATGAYQAVVSGYPQTPEAPAAAYLAGVGLLDQNRPLAAVPYFQLVLDRYAKPDSVGALTFATEQHQELVEAALCLLELSYHRAGNLGQLSGTPHLTLSRMPASKSPWRAYALLIDADALAAQGRYPEAQSVLQTLITEFPTHDIGMHANRLLAWTQAQQGDNDLAIATEDAMLDRYAARGQAEHLASAYLNKAHVLFNEKRYDDAAKAYEEFLSRFPGHSQEGLALYQAGLAYLRLDRSGDAVDRWETLLNLDPGAEIAERAWIRAGDLYFQAEHYEDAKRCYAGLLEHFASSSAAAMGQLRMAQCDYNAGRDAEALEEFSQVASRFPHTPHAREAERGIELALYRLGQAENGAEVLAELVERYPTSSFAADAQFQVARRRYENKEYPEAAAEFRRVVTQFPGFASADQAYFLMGDSHAQAGATGDARTAYEQFLMFFPDSELRSMVQFRLGALRFDAGDYMRAAVDFTAVLDAAPDNEVKAASQYNLALCQRLLGLETEAQAMLEQYRADHPGDERAAEIAYQLADIHEQAGHPDLARAEIERALAAGPTPDRKTELYYRLGLIRERASESEGALQAYAKSIAGPDKKNAFRLSALARAAALYETNGDTQRALRCYRDLAENATDPELVAAAEERASQLKGSNP